MRKRRIGTAKFFTLLLLLYHTSANVPGLSFLESLTPIFTTANYGCMNFMAVAICILVTMHFAENIGHANDKTVPTVALASFVTLINTSREEA